MINQAYEAGVKRAWDMHGLGSFLKHPLTIGTGVGGGLGYGLSGPGEELDGTLHGAIAGMSLGSLFMLPKAYGGYEEYQRANAGGYEGYQRANAGARAREAKVPDWAARVKSKAAAKAAYRAQARARHPDVGGDHRDMQNLIEEWENLQNSPQYAKWASVMSRFGYRR